MITDAFDRETEEILSPEKVYGTHKALCDTCIVTFFEQNIEELRNRFACVKAAEIECVGGSIPCYLLNYKGKEIAFYRTMVGSAGAGACLEEAHCLLGATRFILFGSCGCLRRDIAAGKVIVPTEARRDEGLSYHYAEASDYIKLKNAGFVAEFFREAGIPYAEGKTWTTDAVYRETRGNVEKRIAEGCIAVEMESAGIQAVCDYRNLEFYNFLFSGDLLDAPEWDRRILGAEGERPSQSKGLSMALEMALAIER